MSNVLRREKKQQVIALGQLGWSIRRIEAETRINRETVTKYLKKAGIAVRPPRKRQISKPASCEGLITDFGGGFEVVSDSKPASVSSGDHHADSKPASCEGVITDFGGGFEAILDSKPASVDW